VTRVLRSKELRRVEAGFVVFSFSEHATWLAILVYALQETAPERVVQVLPAVLVCRSPRMPVTAFATAGDRCCLRRPMLFMVATRSRCGTAR
jgi:hypothetical protein